MTNQCTGCAGGPINITCQMCLRAEVERLTDILIACCNASGGQAIKGVSVDFLAHVPAEIAGRIERLARLLENEKIESGRLRDLNGQKQNDLDVANHNLEAWAKRGEHWLTETERLTRERDEARAAMQWKPIADAPYVSRFGFLAGHVGSERIDHCFHRDTAIRLMHTHYRDLPTPPEERP